MAVPRGGDATTPDPTREVPPGCAALRRRGAAGARRSVVAGLAPWAPYGLALLVLAALGLHRGLLAWHWWRSVPPVRPAPPDRWPSVTVQLPVYNERLVADRLIAAAGRLDYPRDLLVVQVLDDSTDDTVAVVAAAVEALRAAGVRAEHRRRDHRIGFKAGALEAGLEASSSELIAVFDADFVPTEDFLRRAVPWFSDPGVGMVQGRWGHLNAGEGWLTRAQSILLDGHFAIEHAARHRSGRWFNFNGTAGVWRRTVIQAAGGWQHDTLTEDLDLSYRAQLAGWRFVYDDDLVVPAELPDTMAAFKAQQRRWATGSVQTARKLLGAIWRSSAPLATRLEATAHLGGNAAYPLIVVLCLGLPLAALAPRLDAWWVGLGLIAAGTGPVVAFYAAAVWATDRSPARLASIPVALALGAGMSVNQTAAVLAGLRGPVGTFERTPKRGAATTGLYGVRGHGAVAVEWLVGVWLALGCMAYVAAWSWAAVPHGALFAAGFLAVALASTRERWGAGLGSAG